MQSQLVCHGILKNLVSWLVGILLFWGGGVRLQVDVLGFIVKHLNFRWPGKLDK